MNTSQLLPVSSAVRASVASSRGWRQIAPRPRRPPVAGTKASRPARKSTDHSMRWATISNGGTLPTARK